MREEASASAGRGDAAAAIAELRARLGERLSTAAAVREQHGKDPTYHAGRAPDAVAFARSTEEVAEIVAICARHGVPVIAFGTGTSLEGHIEALQGGVSVDLSGMDAILEVNAADLDCRVEAGVTRTRLNTHCATPGSSSRSTRARTPRSAAWRRRGRAGRTPCATAPCARRCWG